MFYGFYYLLGTGFINEYMSGSFTGFADERHFAQTFFHHPFKVSSQKTINQEDIERPLMIGYKHVGCFFKYFRMSYYLDRNK
jgi:hypothetical protein